MPSVRPFSLSLMLSLALAVELFAQATSVQWTTDVEGAKATARQSGRLVLLHFWTPECAPCMALEHGVFSQPEVGTAVQARFVPVKVNAQQFPATAQMFGVTRVPTDVIITPKGEVVAKMTSANTPIAYISQLTQAVSGNRSETGNEFARAAEQSPYGNTVHSAYANLPALGQLTPTAPQVPLGENAYSSPATQGQASSIPASPAQVTNPYAAHAPAMPFAASEDRYAASAPAAPQASSSLSPHQAQNPVVPPTMGMSQGDMPARPTTPQAHQQVASDVAASPPEVPATTPPLGFDGYCPVSMKRDWKWVRGDSRWGIVHRGRLYLFASERERDEFWNDPDAFSPALSGIDPVLALDENRTADGQRQFALEFRGQFYLFASEQTLNRFRENADRYAAGVREAMKQSDGRALR